LRSLIAKHGGKMLLATSRYQEAIDHSDITFILIPTPSDRDGHFSNGYLKSAMQSLGEALGNNTKPFHIFVVSSTVTPGSLEGTLIPLIEKHSGRKLNDGFGVCYNPEFVALGAVVRGFKQPDLVIIGESSPAAGEAVAQIHQKICINPPVIRRMSITNAELAKASLNVFMTMKISLGKMLANWCERLPGTNIDVIAEAIGHYKPAVESYCGPDHKVLVDCWRDIDHSRLAGNVEYIALGRASSSTSGASKPIARGNILGVGVSALNMDMAVGKIAQWIDRREPNNVIAVPAHCIVECLRDEKLREIYNRAGMVTPDGMPIAWILKMMGHRHVDRVYGPDLMLAMCKYGLDCGYRHFLYGGWPPSVVEQLAVKLREKFPGIRIVGTFAPPFRPLTPEEDQRVIEVINEAQPDIVWVGLGAAKEEFFSDTHVGKVVAPVLIGVGAAFDFHSGAKPQAPRWMMRSGLEWFFRMLTEPRRLGPRYLRDNPAFLWNIVLQALGLKVFRLENN